MKLSWTALVGLLGVLIGLHVTFVGVGLSPASFLAGLLWDAFGEAAPFYFGSAMGLLAALGLWLVI